MCWKLSLVTWSVLAAFLLALLVDTVVFKHVPWLRFLENGDDETWLMSLRFHKFSRYDRRCDSCESFPACDCSPASATQANCWSKTSAPSLRPITGHFRTSNTCCGPSFSDW